MANGDDIATLLRQKQLMDQLQATTAQGTQTDIIQPNLRAFDDTGGGTQTTSTGVQQPARQGGGQILGALLGDPTAMQRSQQTSPTAQNVPGIGSLATAKSRLGSGIVGLMTGQGLQGFTGGSGVPKSGTVFQEPTNRPTLKISTPPGQPTPQSGQMIQQDPNTGQTTIVPHNPFNTPTPQPATPAAAPNQELNQQFMNLFGKYNPNLGQ